MYAIRLHIKSISITGNIVYFFIINLGYNYNVLMSINLERSLDISNLCQDILSVHPQTRCSSFINRNGRIVESKFRDDSNITGLSKQAMEMLYMQYKLQLSMNEEFNEKLGSLSAIL